MADNDLIALAERCESAKGPDRELDELIRAALFCAQKVVAVRESRYNGAWCVWVEGYKGVERLWEPLGLSPAQRTGAFTASLDAATALVPEGAGWNVGMDDKGLGLLGSANVESADGWPLGQGATAALSLCAAALRARAAA
jgi:hypothetical protein